MELERRLRQRPAFAQAIAKLGRVGIRGHARRHALRTFQDVARAGEALACQVRGGHAIGRGLGRMQLLGVGRITQKLPQARRLRAGRTQGVQHLVGRELEQAAGGDGGGQGAGRARRVENLVVRAPQEFTHPDAHFIARNRRHQQVTARTAQRLRNRQRGREHYGGRMEHRTVVDVVLLHHVGRRRVHHGGKQGRGAAAVDQHFAGSIGRPHRSGIAVYGQHRARRRAGEYRRQAIQQQIFGAAQYRRRDVFVAQFGGKGGQFCA
ncbi:hypothetical protein D3C73_1034540 [compost metagenome]